MDKFGDFSEDSVWLNGDGDGVEEDDNVFSESEQQLKRYRCCWTTHSADCCWQDDEVTFTTFLL